ncbi:hypothetical protein AAG570_000623 [Ranatra chinensis]|uniref:GTPase Era, mitochondrial n=1 Tax=Ranatra chinensis TaxID=642074 RepID=A0ABD0ZIT7_9HEMI
MIVFLTRKLLLPTKIYTGFLKVDNSSFKCFSQLARSCEPAINKCIVGEEKKILKVAIIGTPNSGKSTLINNLVGRKVFAISKKVHTTRCRARAVGIESNTQLVFLDTPGLVSALETDKYKLDKSYVTGGEDAIEEADVIGVVHDISNPYTRHKLDIKVLRLLHLFQQKESFLIINKIDTVKSKRKLLDLSAALTGGALRNYNEPLIAEKMTEVSVMERVRREPQWKHFSDVFMVSALLEEGTKDIKSYLLHCAQPGKWLFKEDVFTDQKPPQIIEGVVRSKLLEYLPYEVPYTVNVKLEYFNREGQLALGYN